MCLGVALFDNLIDILPSPVLLIIWSSASSGIGGGAGLGVNLAPPFSLCDARLGAATLLSQIEIVLPGK